MTGLKTSREVISYDECVAISNKDLAEMWGYFRDFGFYGDEPGLIEASDISDVPKTSFEEWLSKSSIPAQYV